MSVRTSRSQLDINLDLVTCRIYLLSFIPRFITLTKVSPLSSFIYKKTEWVGNQKLKKYKILKIKKYRKNHEQVMAYEFPNSQSCGSVSSHFMINFCESL